MNEKEIKFIDLFGGIGGFHLGLERANDIIRSAQQKNSKECNNSKNKLDNRKFFSCIWYCDKDKYAVETYNKNFQTNYEPTDIRTVSEADVPDFNLLCAGFPCQSFSVAGKRKGFKDTRGTLFFEICRIAQEKKPRMLFLENVKGLLNHDQGRTFEIIITSLSELGYDIEWQVLNSKNFGVPQNRERVFIIGHLRNQCGQQVFPLRQIGSKYIQKGTKQKGQESAWALRSRDYKDGTNLILSRPHGFNKGNIKKEPNIRFSSVQNELVIFDGHHHQFTKEMGTLTGRENRKDTNWLVGKKINEIRRLTPVECERLQGFPDNWTEGVSDTQRYKQLGNAVTVNVIEAIGEYLN